MLRTLYVTRNGLLEPLGQSQVLAYLRGLAQSYEITLLTYEKSEDSADAAQLMAMQDECRHLGIRWLPQRFRPKPKVIAPALSMLRMVWLLWRELRSQRASLIHARSYIPAAVALIVSRMTGVPFIFDMRALWPEELITAGRLRRGSLLYWAIVLIERSCLAHAAAVVSLTHAAEKHLQQSYSQELEDQRIVVIPTCADLERFTPADVPTFGPVVHSCIGTVLSGWFRADWLANWIAVASARDPAAQFEVVTRDDAEQVRQALDPDGNLADRIRIGPRSPEDMPDVIRGHDLSIMFFTDGLGKLGSSPTRMAEVLGCGLPVVANAGVGDVAQIIRKYRVGILVSGSSEGEMNAAWSELEELLTDPELSVRCRRAAEEVFSLEAGTAAYLQLYSEILSKSGGNEDVPA